jgi:hypothetical protein
MTPPERDGIPPDSHLGRRRLGGCHRAWIVHCLSGEGQAALTFAWSLRLTHSDADPERTAIA